MVLVSAVCLIMVYICATFCENIPEGARVIERTLFPFLNLIYKGHACLERVSRLRVLFDNA